MSLQRTGWVIWACLALAGCDPPGGLAADADRARPDVGPAGDAVAPPRDLGAADAVADLDAAPEGPRPCPEFAPPHQTGAIAPPALNEASGLAASRRNPGVLWVHNDSDGGTRVFALDPSGELLAIFELDGAEQVDWEDIAVGPGPEPGRSYVYVGDVGDNGANRATVQLRRFPEPEVVRRAEVPTVRLEGVETFTFVYPDGPHDAGSLMVDPRGGDVYVIGASVDGAAPVHRAAAPLIAGEPIELERVASLAFGVPPLTGDAAPTGADISPAGEAILVRTRGSAFLWRRARGATIAQALTTPPCPAPLAEERQGEAIGFAADGAGYYTTSEGVGAPIYQYAPQAPRPDPEDAGVGPPVDGGQPDQGRPGPCPEFAEAQVTGVVADPAIIEASGVAESRRTPGVLWLHNDAGGANRVFAVTPAGRTRAVFELDGPRPRDWEDLAVGPGPAPGRTYVYVADVGDNFAQRETIRLRRFPEPPVPEAAAAPVPLQGVEDFTLVYPDGPHNCESMMVDPRTGDVFLVTKSADGESPVFRARSPLPADGDVRLERVAHLRFGEAPLGGNTSTTGADISPSGDAILIRTYSHVFLWRRPRGASVAEALGGEPCPLPRPQDRQGEAVGFAADGQGYYTVSEGLAMPVHYHARR